MQDPSESSTPRTSDPSFAPDAGHAGPTAVDVDAPSPAVVPLFLRPKPAVAPSMVDGSLVDSLTRIITGMLEVHVRESVTAAVIALAPRLVVRLPPDDGSGRDAQVRTRPVRRAPHHD